MNLLPLPRERMSSDPAVVQAAIDRQSISWRKLRSNMERYRMLDRLSPTMADELDALNTHLLALDTFGGQEVALGVRYNEISGDSRTIELGLVWGVPQEATVRRQHAVWAFRPLGRYDSVPNATIVAERLHAERPSFNMLDEAGPSPVPRWPLKLHATPHQDSPVRVIQGIIGDDALAPPHHFSTESLTSLPPPRALADELEGVDAIDQQRDRMPGFPSPI